MIAGILGLILVAAGLLVGGLTTGSNRLLAASVVASLLSALLLLAGNRQAARKPSRDDSEEFVSGATSERRRHRELVGSHVGERPPVAPEATKRREPAHAARHEPRDEWVGGASEHDDPPDEPPVQRRPARVAVLVARMDTDVFVIDGRPRYHVAGCAHVSGHGAEPLPVSEATELGFSPCGLCEPDAVLAGGTTAGP